MNTVASITNVPEHELLESFAALVTKDQTTTAELLRTMDEIDRRQLWAKEACSSMFAFCVERFGMSESMANKRIRAARTARKFPMVFEMVSRGELHLSAISQLAKHLTEENHREVLARATHKTMREVERLVAEIAPRPDEPARIRALPRLRGAPLGLPDSRGTAPPMELGSALGSRPDLQPEQRPRDGSELPIPRPSRAEMTLLSPRRYKLVMTVSEETHDKLRRLQDLLSHQVPDGDPAVITDKAFDLLLKAALKQKAALTGRPRRTKRRRNKSDGATRAERSRTIPAAIRREVWTRDGGRCAFIDGHGRQCGATRLIEYHHTVPFAKGGTHEVNNIELRCHAHNQYEAGIEYGNGFMDEKRGRRTSPAGVREERSVYRRLPSPRPNAVRTDIDWARAGDDSQSQNWTVLPKGPWDLDGAGAELPPVGRSPAASWSERTPRAQPSRLETDARCGRRAYFIKSPGAGPEDHLERNLPRRDL